MQLMPADVFAELSAVEGFCALNGADYATYVFVRLISTRKRYSCLMELLDQLGLEYLTDVEKPELLRRARKAYADEPLALQLLESSDPLQRLREGGIEFTFGEA